MNNEMKEAIPSPEEVKAKAEKLGLKICALGEFEEFEECGFHAVKAAVMDEWGELYELHCWKEGDVVLGEY